MSEGRRLYPVKAMGGTVLLVCVAVLTGYAIRVTFDMNRTSMQLVQSERLAFQSRESEKYFWKLGGKRFPQEIFRELRQVNLRATGDARVEIDGKAWGICVVLPKVECNTCLAETVSFIDELQRYERSLSLAMIGYAEQPSYLQRLAKINGLTFPVYLDNKQLIRGELGIEEGPVIILYSKLAGNICYAFRPMPAVPSRTEMFRDVVFRMVKLQGM